MISAHEIKSALEAGHITEDTAIDMLETALRDGLASVQDARKVLADARNYADAIGSALREIRDDPPPISGSGGIVAPGGL